MKRIDLLMKRIDLLKSEDVRLERKAVRAYLRRQIKRLEATGDELRSWSAVDRAEGALSGLKNTLDWLLTRQKRDGARSGELGKR